METIHQHHLADVFLPPKDEEKIFPSDQLAVHSSPDSLLVLSGGIDSTTMLYEFGHA